MERWVAVSGYESLYSVSDLGRVRIEVRRHNIRQGAILAQCPQRDGYLHVGLRRDHEKSSKTFAVSRLVLTAFASPPKPGLQANHKNGDITDNRLSNLEWCTAAENIKHSIAVLGHGRDGENNPAAKLTASKVVQLRERAKTGETYISLGKRFGITTTMACSIARGKAWKTTGGPIMEARPKGRPKLSR